MTKLSPAQQPYWDEEESPPRVNARVRWGDRLHHAFRGIKLGVRGTSSFFVHFFFAAMILAAGIVLHCALLEWCILAGGVAMVLITELFHSAMETVVRSLERGSATRAQPALAISSGAVLVARLTVALLGGLILISRLQALLPKHSDM